jgi:methionyl-tRNA formyltransferase
MLTEISSFRGAAPIHRTLLAGEKKTGITLQTLHPKRMDHGVILDQTPFPGFDIPNADACTVPELLDLVTPKAAEMLSKGVQNQIFVPPLKDVGWRTVDGEEGLRPAGKIRPEDRHINWNSWTWEEIQRRDRVLGSPWSRALVPHSSTDVKELQPKRIIFTKIRTPEEADQLDRVPVPPGLPFILEGTKALHSGWDKRLFIYTSDGQLVQIYRMKVEGERESGAYAAALKANMILPGSSDGAALSYSTFHGPLQ